MKPDTADSVLLPERTLGKGVKVIADEVANGEYGLVINGHSLVRHETSSLVLVNDHAELNTTFSYRFL